MRPLIAFFERLPKAAVIVICLVLVLAMGELDYITGYESTLSVFYVFPVFLVTWFVNMKWGVIFSALIGIIWLTADLLSGHQYSSPAIAFWNMMVIATTFMVIASAVSRINRMLEAEKTYARTDALTGVSNARHFEELAKSIIDGSAPGRKCALAYIDLDNFKGINDNFGHSVGDQLLKLVAEIIKKNLREGDIVARLGGDEFGVLLPGATEESCQMAMKRMQEHFLVEVKKKKWPVSFSLGLVLFKKLPDNVDEMIKRADNLMYTVKGSGKNDIKFIVYQ